MNLTIIIFGQLREITGNAVSVEQVNSTDELTAFLVRKYPELGSVPFKIAVNRQLVHENTVLAENCEVALLPPYSGG